MMLELVEFDSRSHPPLQLRVVEYKGFRSNENGTLCLFLKRPGFAGHSYRDVMHLKRVRLGGREWVAPPDTTDPQGRADEIRLFVESNGGAGGER
jgi:hypothetical protein